MRPLQFLLMVGALILAPLAMIALAATPAPDASAIEMGQNLSRAPVLSVETIRENWWDAERDRALPVKIYLPAGRGPAPVIVFSHGLGRSCEDYAYLGLTWATRGFMTVFVQHPGSDESVWKGTLRPHKNLKRAYDNKNNLYRRPDDLRFALDRLARLQSQGVSWAGRADLSRVGVAGNDWGAEAAMSLAGEVMPNGRSNLDPRVRAMLALSPTVDPGAMPWEAAYGDIRVPCFYISGTDDNGRIGVTKASERRIPFDSNNLAEQYLMILYGGDHMVYAGHRHGRREMAQDAVYQGMIREASCLFWEAYLKNDASAVCRMAEGELKALIRGQARLERKTPSPKSLAVSQ
jgi:pimeloyl-ACP methyl ester carboxylesterase